MAAARVTWVGHATVVVDLGGVRFVTDPVLRGRLAHLRRQYTPEKDDIDSVDAVLISHMHLDHMDMPTLKAMDRDIELVVPFGAGATVAKLGFDTVTSMHVGESITIGDVRVTATVAIHDGRRHPGGPRAETLGFLFEHDGRRIYFAGDTDLFDGMRKIGAPGLDLALLPVWGWGPSLGEGHMDPRAAAEAAALLQPKLTIPIHWGSFFPVGMKRMRGSERLTEPPKEFAAHVAELAPGVDVVVLDPGGSIDLL